MAKAPTTTTKPVALSLLLSLLDDETASAASLAFLEAARTNEWEEGMREKRAHISFSSK